MSVDSEANHQQIDWSGIRAAAVALNSVRDAAMRAAAHLPQIEQNRFVERVNKRAYRERWLDQAKALAKPRDNGAALPLSKTVQTGAETLQNTLNEHERATRLSLAKYSRKAAAEAEEANLEQAPYVHKAAQVAGIAFKWDQKSGPAANVMVNIALMGVDPGSVQVEGEVLDNES